MSGFVAGSILPGTGTNISNHEDFDVMSGEKGIVAQPSTKGDALAKRYVDLALPRLGSEVVFASDDFFADKSRMIDPAPAVFYPDLYDENGKWMDGWESRRKRAAGYDHAVLRLGVPGRVRLLDIDTSHFTGNFPPAASLDGCVCADDVPGPGTEWHEIVPATSLQGNSHHIATCEDKGIWTHVRLNIYPDGGMARLRLYGEVHVNWDEVSGAEELDLASLLLGARAIAWSDAHYGSPNFILAPGRGINMGDGWETRRRREPGNDWIIVELAHPGEVSNLLVDTAHYKGNFPAGCSIQAANVTGGTTESVITQSMFWPTLLPEQPLTMDAEHHFAEEIEKLGPISHVRLNIIPDGGISRLRVFGRLVK